MHMRRPAAYFHHQGLDSGTCQHAGEDGGGLILSARLPATRGANLHRSEASWATSGPIRPSVLVGSG